MLGTAIIAIAGSDTSGFSLIIVGSDLSQGKPKKPIVLLVEYIGIEAMF
jgi:hypothetical protein